MNRFAALDSDNEEEVKTQKVTEKKTPAAKTETAQPAAAPKKTENKPKNNDSKPRPKKDRAPKAESAAPAASGEVVEASKENKVRSKNFNRAPKTRYEKKQDDPLNPMIKADNRIRGSAHANQRRRPFKHNKDDAEHTAKDAEKHPENVEGEESTEPATEEVEQTPEPVVEQEPEPAKLGLEDYLRQREEARANSALLNEVKTARAVNDLSGLKIKEGDDLPSVYTGTAKQSKTAKVVQRSTVKTVFSDLSFKVDVPVVTEERRTQQRGNFKNSKQQKPRGPRVDLSDASAFPSL